MKVLLSIGKYINVHFLSFSGYQYSSFLLPWPYFRPFLSLAWATAIALTNVLFQFIFLLKSLITAIPTPQRSDCFLRLKLLNGCSLCTEWSWFLSVTCKPSMASRSPSKAYVHETYAHLCQIWLPTVPLNGPLLHLLPLIFSSSILF